MTDDNMRMASFRIDKDLWAKFSAVAKRERYTVTEALTDYIQICTGNDRLELSGNTSNDSVENDKLVVSNDTVLVDNDVVSLVNIAIDKALSTSLAPLTESLAELENYTQEQFKAVREELKKPLAIV